MDGNDRVRPTSPAFVRDENIKWPRLDNVEDHADISELIARTSSLSVKECWGTTGIGAVNESIVPSSLREGRRTRNRCHENQNSKDLLQQQRMVLLRRPEKVISDSNATREISNKLKQHQPTRNELNKRKPRNNSSAPGNEMPVNEKPRLLLNPASKTKAKADTPARNPEPLEDRATAAVTAAFDQQAARGVI